MKRPYTGGESSSVKRICLTKYGDDHDESRESDFYSTLKQMRSEVTAMQQQLTAQQVLNNSLRSDLLLSVTTMHNEITLWRERYTRLEAFVHRVYLNSGTTTTNFLPYYDIESR